MGVADKTLLKLTNRSEESFHCCGDPMELVFEHELDVQIGKKLPEDASKEPVTVVSRLPDTYAKTPADKERKSDPGPRKCVPVPDFYQVPGPLVPPCARHLTRKTHSMVSPPSEIEAISDSHDAIWNRAFMGWKLSRKKWESKPEALPEPERMSQMSDRAPSPMARPSLGQSNSVKPWKKLLRSRNGRTHTPSGSNSSIESGVQSSSPDQLSTRSTSLDKPGFFTESVCSFASYQHGRESLVILFDPPPLAKHRAKTLGQLNMGGQASVPNMWRRSSLPSNTLDDGTVTVKVARRKASCFKPR